jgi:RimK family alpha-L-glutamate ligase
MRVAILGEPHGWHVERLARAVAARGHAADLIRWDGLAAGIAADGAEWFLPAEIHAADVIAVRGMPGREPHHDRLEEVVFRMDLLGRLAARGTPVVNPPAALEAAIDKYLSLCRLAAAGLPVPRTQVVQGTGQVLDAYRGLGGDCVLKPLFGSRGRGIVRIDTEAAAAAVAAMPSRVAYLQEFIPHAGWDVRILVVGGRIFSMRRLAPPGEWRTNISLGGTPQPFDPPAAWIEIAVRAASALGAEIAGVDLLPTPDGRIVVLEVNGVPAWRGLEEATGHDIAAAIATQLTSR